MLRYTYIASLVKFIRSYVFIAWFPYCVGGGYAFFFFCTCSGKTYSPFWLQFAFCYLFDFLLTFSSVFMLSGSYNNLVYNWYLGNGTNRFNLNLFNLVTDMFEIKVKNIFCQFSVSPRLITCNNSRTAENCYMRFFRPRYLPTFVDISQFVAKSTTKQALHMEVRKTICRYL